MEMERGKENQWRSAGYAEDGIKGLQACVTRSVTDTPVYICSSEKRDPEKLGKCHEMQSQHNNTDCLETHLLVPLRIPPPSLSQNEVSAREAASSVENGIS